MKPANALLPIDEEENAVQQRVFQAMTPEQRWRAAEQLYWSARELKAAALRSWNPDLPEEQVQRMVREAFMYARS